MRTLFVSGLPFSVDNTALYDAFTPYGPVVRATVIYDRETRKSRGFGFVQMRDEAGAADAIAGLNRASWDGLTLVVRLDDGRARKAAQAQHASSS